MRKRAQRFEDSPHDNVGYYGLRLGQVVTVTCPGYRGPAKIVGSPPQGTGIYVETPQGERLWIGGEEIAEATEPT